MVFFVRRMEVLEEKLAVFRAKFYLRNRDIASASILALIISFCCYFFLLGKANVLYYVCPLIPVLMWSFFIGNYCLGRPTGSEKVRTAPVNHNVYVLCKTIPQVLALAFFTYLDGNLKEKNRVLGITLCISFYIHSVLAMVIFSRQEDFDITSGFIAAGFQQFYESSEGLETLVLILVTSVLWSLRNFLIGGRSFVEKKRPGSEARAILKMQDYAPRQTKLEKALASFRTRFYSLNDVLSASAMSTFLLSLASFIKLNEDIMKYYYISFCTLLFVWLFCIFVYGSTRRAYVEELTEDRGFHNIYTIIKSVVQVIALALFTFLDDKLEAQNRVWAITLCIALYLHLVLVMVILRLQEEFDLVLGCLAAGFGLFYKISGHGWEKLVLILVTVILASVKNYLVGGKGKGSLLELDDDKNKPVRKSRRSRPYIDVVCTLFRLYM